MWRRHWAGGHTDEPAAFDEQAIQQVAVACSINNCTALTLKEAALPALAVRPLIMCGQRDQSWVKRERANCKHTSSSGSAYRPL